MDTGSPPRGVGAMGRSAHGCGPFRPTADGRTLTPVPNHLTPDEIAAEHAISREDVLRFCVEHDVPVFHGQIDKTLFAAEWKAAQVNERTQE